MIDHLNLHLFEFNLQNPNMFSHLNLHINENDVIILFVTIFCMLIFLKNFISNFEALFAYVQWERFN